MTGSVFQGQAGFGVSVMHRFADVSMPIYLSAAYGNGGGSEHVGRVGLGIEW
jgi:hypothetical protein